MEQQEKNHPTKSPNDPFNSLGTVSSVPSQFLIKEESNKQHLSSRIFYTEVIREGFNRGELVWKETSRTLARDAKIDSDKIKKTKPSEESIRKHEISIQNIRVFIENMIKFFTKYGN